MGLLDFLDDLFSDNSEKEEELITVDISQLGWKPDSDERVLVAHGDCKIMKDGGKEVAEAFGKVHFVANEASSQRLICCVTNKRLVIIPQDDKEKAKAVFSIGSTVAGIDWYSKTVASYIFFNRWLEFSVSFLRDEIKSAELSEMPVANILIVKFKNGDVLYLSTAKLGHSMDIVSSIMQPGIFME